MTYRPHYRHPRTRKTRGGGGLPDKGAARAITVLIFCAIVLLALILALLTPYALNAVSGPTGHWERLSFIAQVVGAGLAVVTVFAFAGALVSLRQQAQAQQAQAREYRAAREQAIRTEHRELMKMAMDRPLLNTVWGEPADPGLADDDPDALSYANMIMGFWMMAYLGDVTGETEVRLAARTFFTGRIGRAYWSRARAARAEASRDDAERRFHDIIDDEYQVALDQPPVPDEPIRPATFVGVPAEAVRSGEHGGTVATPSSRVGSIAAGLLLGIAVGFVLGRGTAEPVRRYRRGH